ncbi:type II secretion system protein GspL [uncultured Pluralibacter sp.]|uniref:type II secretion system protein GspL n=1 Tax=uncultured Pluralibacter sp. TaxID=1490864 RepID=UPI0026080875|nr:type II secretion system protein GspL [uncultured Pluralibacter sp.]
MKTRFQLRRPQGKRLFLRLPLAVDGPLGWWFGDPLSPQDAQFGELASVADIGTLPEIARQSPAVLWLPAEQCVLEPVAFSGKARLRPEQLAQLLAENLGEEVGDWLWWRLPNREPRPLLLGCPREWLTAVMTAVNAAGLNIIQLLPELAALPDEPAVLTSAGGRWLYRERGGRGAWLHPDWVAEILPQWRDSDALALYGPAPYPDARWATQSADGGEALLARHSGDSGINLLSQLPAGLQPRSGTRYWPWATGLLAAAMLLALAGTGAAALYLHLQASRDQAQIAALYQRWLPQDKREDVDAVDRLRRQRRSLIQQFGSANFFNAFWQYAQLQRPWSAPQIQRLAFDRDKRALVVDVSLSEADAKRVPAQAKQAGAAVKLAPAASGQVTATLTLRGPNEN